MWHILAEITFEPFWLYPASVFCCAAMQLLSKVACSAFDQQLIQVRLSYKNRLLVRTTKAGGRTCINSCYCSFCCCVRRYNACCLLPAPLLSVLSFQAQLIKGECMGEYPNFSKQINSFEVVVHNYS